MHHLHLPKTVWFFWLFFLLTVSCKESGASQKADASPAETFQNVLNEVVAQNKDVPGIMLHVEAPGLNISWNGAAGVSDVETGTPIQANQPFRVASVTKTFVATAILRLWEEGKLSLDDPISKYISETHTEILKRGGYDPDKIKIRHLLSHTSGLFDYAVGSRSYVDAVKQDPKHRWTRTEQLQGAMDWGKPYGAPGSQYHYSDTGYILLGETLEQVYGKPLATALRELVGYERLGLSATWLESLEAPPTSTGDRVHQYLDETDTYDWDPSIDLYGGGGIVATTSDIARFYYQLFQNKVYTNAATLDSMIQKISFPAKPQTEKTRKGPRREPDYRFGVEVIEIFGQEVYLHTGFWGTQVAYIPNLNASVAINFIKGDNLFLLKRIILMIKDMEEAEGS